MAAPESLRLTRQIVVAMLAGIALGVALNLPGTAPWMQNVVDGLLHVLHMAEWIMRLAPYGVFALIARTFATQGLDLLLPLAAYFLTLTAALAIQLFGTYPLLLRLLASLNPITFSKKMRDPAAFAFSTASSGATIPVTLHTVEYKMGVKNSSPRSVCRWAPPSTWTAPP